MQQRGATATIPINTAISNGIDLWNCKLVGIIMPGAWTAADIAFQVAQVGDAFSGDNTYRNLVDETGARVFVAAAASTEIVFKQDLRAKLRAARHIKIVSYNNAGSANVNQTAARELIPMVECC